MFGRDAGGLRGKRSKDGPLGAAGRSGSGLSPTGSGLFGMPAPGLVGMPSPGQAHSGFQTSAGFEATKSFGAFGSPSFGSSGQPSSFGSSRVGASATSSTASFGSATGAPFSFGATSATAPTQAFSSGTVAQPPAFSSTTEAQPPVFSSTVVAQPPAFSGTTAAQPLAFSSTTVSEPPAYSSTTGSVQPSQPIFGGNAAVDGSAGIGSLFGSVTGSGGGGHVQTAETTPPKTFGFLSNQSSAAAAGEPSSGSLTPGLFKAPTESNLFKSTKADGAGLFSSSGGPFASAPSGGLFKSVSSSEAANAPTTLFGKGAEETSGPPGTPALFKARSTSPSNIFAPSTSSSEGLFKEAGQLFSGAGTSSEGLFKTAADAVRGGSDNQLFGSPPPNLFGGNSSTTAGSKKSLFGKPVSDLPENDEVSAFMSEGKQLFGQPSDTQAKMISRPPLEQPDITLVKPSVRRGPSPAMVARLGPRQPQGLEASRLAPLPSVQDDDFDEQDEEEEEEGQFGEGGNYDNVGEEGEEEAEEGEWQDDEGAAGGGGGPDPALQQHIPPTTKPEPKKKLVRAVSKEELKNLTTIICEEVPKIFNNVETLTNHFKKYGNVTKVVADKATNTAKVNFADHKAAKNAKDNGKVINPKARPIGNIMYSIVSPDRGRVRRSTSRSNSGEGSRPPSAAATAVKPTSQPPTVKLPLKKEVFRIKQALKPPPAAEAEPPSINMVMKQGDLLKIMKMQTQTDSDRLNVLDARDKYIRLKNPRSHTRTGLPLNSEKLEGTCPDLCPERERYSRSAKMQLRWFEKIDNNIHHAAVIKEHSRSAADQDVPLSHELRPPSVLSKTLDFLMCNMVDRVDYMAGSMKSWFSFVLDDYENGSSLSRSFENFVPDTNQPFHTVGDWFEYIWSTTRGLRKDITQQSLTDTLSVSLVEKCARFHIFCSERLIEVDAFNFDPKLNSENLTKCLQSLKHMYYDLSLEGVSCENEAEFRSYEILLNLNQGDTLREAQCLEPHVRNDPRVVQALNICSALNNNNYVRFFRLFKQSSYLEMCIIKRYFYQVRRIAVEIMTQSYVPPRTTMQYPLRKMVDLLAFESEAECASFLRAHGIESELEEEPTIFLDKSTFFHPETAPPAVRSRRLIDAKKTCSYGEIMNGGPLPDNPYPSYTPHNSFDDQGYLKVESYEARDQVVMQTPEELERLEREQERRVRLAEYSKSLSEDVIDEFVELEAERIAQDTIRETMHQSLARELYSRLEAEVCSQECAALSAAVMREHRNKILMERLEIERKEEEEEESVKEIITDMVDDNIKQVAKDSMDEWKHQQKLEQHKKVALFLCDGLVEEGIKGPIRDVAQQAIKEFEAEREAKIKLLEDNLSKKLVTKVFKAWRLAAMKAKKQREAISDFPVGPSHLTAQQQNHRLAGSSAGAKYSLLDVERERSQLNSMFKMLDMKESILQSAILLPFNLVDIMEQHVPPKGSCITWKLLLSTNNLEDEADYFSLEQMVKRKLIKMFPASSTKEEDPGLLVVRTVPLNRAVLSVCVRNLTEENTKSSTFSESERLRLFSGTSGVLFLHLDPAEQPSQRLLSVLVNRPRVPAVPVHVLTCWPVGRFSEEVDLAGIKEKGNCSNIDVQHVSSDLYNIDNIVGVTESFRRLVEARPIDHTRHLTKKCLGDFIAGFINPQVFGEMGRNLKSRRSKGLAHRAFADLVYLYNDGLEHLKRVLVDPELAEVSWPVPEFGRSSTTEKEGGEFCLPADWNDTLRVDEIIRDIDDLKLEDFTVYESDSWRNLEEQVWVYIDAIALRGNDTSVLCSELRGALTRAYRKFATQCCLMGGEEKTTPPPEMLPWTDILICAAQYKIGCLAGAGRVVGYRDEQLIDFVLPKEWTSGLSWKEEHAETTVMEHLNNSVSAYRDSLHQPETLLNPELRIILKKEQRLSLRMEARLEAALAADYVPRSDSLAVNCSTSFNGADRGLDDSFSRLSDSAMIGEEEGDAIESVPIISYVSPSLGRMASHVDRRRERRTTGMSPRLSNSPRTSAAAAGGKENRRSLEGERKRKATETLSAEKRKRGASRAGQGHRLMEREPKLEVEDKLDVLRRSINLEITESARFEQMLQEAIDTA